MVYGANDEAGQFVTSIANSQAHTGLAVKYFDWIPWYLRVYLHTIKVSINGTLGNLSHFSSSLLYSLLLLIRLFFLQWTTLSRHCSLLSLAISRQ